MVESKDTKAGAAECPLVLDTGPRNSIEDLGSKGVPEKRGASEPSAQEIEGRRGPRRFNLDSRGERKPRLTGQV